MNNDILGSIVCGLIHDTDGLIVKKNYSYFLQNGDKYYHVGIHKDITTHTNVRPKLTIANHITLDYYINTIQGLVPFLDLYVEIFDKVSELSDFRKQLLSNETLNKKITTRLNEQIIDRLINVVINKSLLDENLIKKFSTYDICKTDEQLAEEIVELKKRLIESKPKITVDRYKSFKKNNITNTQIADFYEISERTLYRFIEKNNLNEDGKKKKSIKEFNYELYIELKKEGLKDKEIATKLNMSAATLSRNIKKMRG